MEDDDIKKHVKALVVRASHAEKPHEAVQFAQAALNAAQAAQVLAATDCLLPCDAAGGELSSK